MAGPRRYARPARRGARHAAEGDAALNPDGFTLETHTASDGYAWRYRRYAPSGPPLARVVCVHGIQSHGGWYVHSCRRMAEAGFEVFFLDRRGSGLNEKDRGDTPTFRRLLQDVAEFLEAKQKEDPSRKTFLVGISWGGKTAAGVQKWQPGIVDGIALLCPGFYPRVSLTFWEDCRVLWARLNTPKKLFPIPLSDPTLFTETEKWLRFLRDDPLSLRQATARFLCMSAVLDFYLQGASKRVNVPTLLMLAGRDRIIDNEKTRRFVGRFVGPKEVIEYPEAHHTLEFEPDPDRHVRDLVGWLQRQVKETGGVR